MRNPLFQQFNTFKGSLPAARLTAERAGRSPWGRDDNNE
jgi:hypothetical protein